MAVDFDRQLAPRVEQAGARLISPRPPFAIGEDHLGVELKCFSLWILAPTSFS
jgi:hypothetical protein